VPGAVLRRFAIAWLAAALAVPGIARAQYPAKPVRLIAPAAPGGNPDVLARLLAQKLSDAFGKPFVVENMPGAGGVVAAEMVSRAPADGHTLMLGDSGSLAVNVVLNPKITYQPLRDFVPITALVSVPTVLVVHPSVPANTLEEFVRLAKSRPGRLSYGSAGNGSIHHLTMAIFAARAGIDVLHVPYKGGTALVGGVLAGDVQAGFSGIPNVLQSIKAGRLRVLGISIPRRSISLPEVPTFAELGYPGFDVATTIGLQAPAGTPRDVVQRLQVEVAKALRAPDIAERIANLGMELMENGTDQYTQYMKDDLERYAVAVKAAGIKIE
jgi:tripartite-type tricarboxylate transporter receptor subunit TctC